jgi:hypothetical protein
MTNPFEITVYVRNSPASPTSLANQPRVAATLYQLFLAEGNFPELFAQFERIHSLAPYTLLKNVIRIANPAAVMSSVLDLFLTQPFRSQSLLQRISP